MTPQEIFDTAVIGIIKQKGRSVDDNGICLYRGDNGMKCAVGQVLPDKFYDPEMEHKSVNALIREFSTIPAYISNNAELLSTLQQAHDYANEKITGYDDNRFIVLDHNSIPDDSEEFVVSNFFGAALKVAKMYDLSTAKVEEVYYARNK